MITTEKSTVYHVVNGPVGRLSLAEAAVGEVSDRERDVLAGAGKQQLGAVDDHHVTVPVQTAGPPTALHLHTETFRRMVKESQRLSETVLVLAKV